MPTYFSLLIIFFCNIWTTISTWTLMHAASSRHEKLLFYFSFTHFPRYSLWRKLFPFYPLYFYYFFVALSEEKLHSFAVVRYAKTHAWKAILHLSKWELKGNQRVIACQLAEGCTCTFFHTSTNSMNYIQFFLKNFNWILKGHPTLTRVQLGMPKVFSFSLFLTENHTSVLNFFPHLLTNLTLVLKHLTLLLRN